MTIAMVAAALRSFADGAPDGTVRIPASYARRLAEALLQAQDSQPAQVAQPSNHPAFAAGPADAGSHDLRTKVLALPRRIEPLGGQRTSYVQLDNVLALIEADAGSHETLTIARAAKFFRDFAEDTVLDVETLLFCAAWLENDPDAAPASAPAANAGICMFCDGCGWCEGSPAFTCPRCKGNGLASAPAACSKCGGQGTVSDGLDVDGKRWPCGCASAPAAPRETDAK